MIRGAVRAALRGVGVVAMTAVEVTALSVWLGLADGAAPLSATAGIGVAALAAGLLVETLLAHLAVNGRSRPVPPATVASLAVAETAAWVGWLAVIRATDGPLGVVGAGVGLAVALAVGHAVADNAVRGREPLASLVGRVPAELGVLEAAGASAWVLVVSGAVAVPAWAAPVALPGVTTRVVAGTVPLAVALVVQHALAVRYALRTAREVEGIDWRSSWGTPPE